MKKKHMEPLDALCYDMAVMHHTALNDSNAEANGLVVSYYRLRFDYGT